jgi:hypothetical protein
MLKTVLNGIVLTFKSCDGCPEIFSSFLALLKHMREVHNPQTVLCCPVQACPLKYCSTAQAFEQHLMSHQKEKIFKCESCEYHCYNMRQLEAHLDSGHRYRTWLFNKI